MTNEGIEGIAVLNIPTLRVEVREVSRREGKGRRNQTREVTRNRRNYRVRHIVTRLIHTSSRRRTVGIYGVYKSPREMDGICLDSNTYTDGDSMA